MEYGEDDVVVADVAESGVNGSHGVPDTDGTNSRERAWNAEGPNEYSQIIAQSTRRDRINMQNKNKIDDGANECISTK